MAQPADKIYTSAMRKGSVQRYGKLVMVVMAGEGAVLVPQLEWATTQKWAMSKNATGAPMRDRQMLFDRLEAFVSRPGSFISTKGNHKALADIVKAMKENGLDPKEWVLPPDLREDKKPDQPEPAEKDAPAEPAAAAPEPAPEQPAPIEQQGFWVREKKD